MAVRNKRMNTRLLDKDSPWVYREAYNALKMNVSCEMRKRGKKVLLITSALPTEGKSTLSINLASSLAQNGAKVLLIDCDLRKSGVAALLQMDEDCVGLADMLMGKKNSGQAIQSIPQLGIDVIPAGRCEVQPIRLLEKKAMGIVLSVVREHYDYILCDAPPVLSVTDAAVLSQLCECVLLVVRKDKTVSRDARRAKRSLERVGANIIGVVMNCCASSRKKQRYYGSYE